MTFKFWELTGFIIEADGAPYTYLSTKQYALLRKEELEACGFDNVTITPLFKRQQKPTREDDGPLRPSERVDRLFDGNDSPTYEEIEDIIWDAEFDAVNFKAIIADRHGI